MTSVIIGRFEIVMSLPAMSLGLRFCTLKSANSMTASRLGYRKALVGTGWAISLLLCMNWLSKQSCGLVWPSFLLVCTAGHWPRAVTIENSLMSGCGLSHKSAA